MKRKRKEWESRREKRRRARAWAARWSATYWRWSNLTTGEVTSGVWEEPKNRLERKREARVLAQLRAQPGCFEPFCSPARGA